jgi:threonylcarbamoyladenosine tRNA methylthiotransferase MtaB
VINSCAVTAEAVRQARQTIRKLKRERPAARIVVTGCAAQTQSADFTAMPEVDRVLGNEEKLDPAAWRGGSKVAVGDIMAALERSLALARKPAASAPQSGPNTSEAPAPKRRKTK